MMQLILTLRLINPIGPDGLIDFCLMAHQIGLLKSVRLHRGPTVMPKKTEVCWTNQSFDLLKDSSL